MKPLDLLSELEKDRVRITAIKAMQMKNTGGQSLIKVETDAGICGIGEAGASTRNFVMSETRISQLRLIHEMGQEEIHVQDGKIKVPDEPGWSCISRRRGSGILIKSGMTHKLPFRASSRVFIPSVVYK